MRNQISGRNHLTTVIAITGLMVAWKFVAFGQDIRGGYKYLEIRIVGASVIDDRSIRETLGVKPGDAYDVAALGKGFGELQKLYGNRGYASYVAQPEFEFDDGRKIVALTVKIEEGLRYTVNRISLTGNVKVSDATIRSELALKEGAVFDRSVLESSLARLNRTGLFETILIEDAKIEPLPNEPKLDINLKVKEQAQ